MIHLMYGFNEKRDNEVWSFDYNGKPVRMYKEFTGADKDKWFLDYHDFAEATNLQGLLTTYIYNHIPLRYKSIQLFGKDQEDLQEFDQRDTISTEGFPYLFNDFAMEIKEVEMFYKELQRLNIAPVAIDEIMCPKPDGTIFSAEIKMNDEDMKAFNEIFNLSTDKIANFKNLENLLDKIIKEKLAENLKKKKDNELKEKSKGKVRDNFGCTITFTKQELTYLQRFVLKGITPFLCNQEARHHLCAAFAKIHEAYQGIQAGD